jgi:hypothetical protein
MEELKVKANNYAEENVINVLKEAFAKVYADGYRDGYKDCEEEIPVDLRLNETEFIDLGLPSGTLWSSSYERIGEERLYLPYDKAKEMNIPTEDQWRELRKECKWSIDSDKLYCIGPNGNSINFERTGYISIKKNKEIADWSFFWIKNEEENGNECYSAKMSWLTASDERFYSIFRGYSLPIRLVRNA